MKTTTGKRIAAGIFAALLALGIGLGAASSGGPAHTVGAASTLYHT